MTGATFSRVLSTTDTFRSTLVDTHGNLGSTVVGIPEERVDIWVYCTWLGNSGRVLVNVLLRLPHLEIAHHPTAKNCQLGLGRSPANLDACSPTSQLAGIVGRLSCIERPSQPVPCNLALVVLVVAMVGTGVRPVGVNRSRRSTNNLFDLDS